MGAAGAPVTAKDVAFGLLVGLLCIVVQLVFFPKRRETLEEWVRRRVRENREKAKRDGA